MKVCKFLHKWLICSWWHRKVRTQLNARGNYKWVKVSGRCYPRVDIPEGQPGSNDWHCTYCWPCGSEVAEFFRTRTSE